MLTIRQSNDVTVYGPGVLGGKAEGLAALSGWNLPRCAALPTHVLAAGLYDRYLEGGRVLAPDDRAVMASILDQLGDHPIGVRSSATNESGTACSAGGAIHAGEHLSFMLPNNNHDPAVRLDQLALAVRHIYEHFIAGQGTDTAEKMAVVINPIPGLFDDTAAGPFFYPYISGVADSFFPYALRTQDPKEGYARIAFGHGYATVLDDFPVISMATIRNPIPLDLMRTGGGQQFFYALDMTRNAGLGGDELETMKRLHVRHANFHKIRLLGVKGKIITIEELVQRDHFGFKGGLEEIMAAIAARSDADFQIEFVFNIDFKRKPYADGVFHVVQLTRLPRVTFDAVEMPADAGHTYLSIRSLQGHGVKRGIRYAVVVSPFLYAKDRHDEVRARLAEVNLRMRRDKERYVAVVPGRLGSGNRDWGIRVEYKDVDQAVGIFEYGVDIAGRDQPLPEEGSLTGGIYGSHFLYMALGGYSEDQRRMQARMYGTQGTHFFTNIMGSGVIYGYISPVHDVIDPWFFSPPDASSPLYVLRFPEPVAIYADSLNERCVVVRENG